MDHQQVPKRQAYGFNIVKVKENVVGLLFVSSVMGMVGFVVGTRERANDFDVQHRKILAELRAAINRHEFKIEKIEAFYDVGQELRKDCSILQNDVDHWISLIKDNAQGIKEVRAECRNLITKTWENLNHDHN